MAPKWIGFCVFLWVIGLLIGSVPQGEVLPLNSTVTNPVQGVMSYAEVWDEQDWGTLVMPITHLSFFRDIFRLMILDLPLFGPISSPWQIIRWIVLAPIIGTVVFGLVILFISIFRKTV